MAHSAFLVVPTGEPAEDADWNALDRTARIDRLQSHLAELGEQIGARLGELDLEYLEGAGAWTVRSREPKERQELVDRLAGLPVEVATDDRFYAL
ncbi:MAG: hypothetical protein QOJ27_1233 [Sphingomonadales bacterium]|nr:hypothetical protein [Sphingomonadales bacterium]